MVTTSINEHGNCTFLSVLKRSWPASNKQFSEEDELYFINNLVPFCNNSNEISLSGADLHTIHIFIENSITNLLNLTMQLGYVDEDIKERFSYILIFIEFLAHHYNQKITTQLFLKKLLERLLSFPIDIEDPVNINLVMDCYDSTDLLHSICHFLITLNLIDVSEELISQFMKKARYSQQTRVFRFYLYPFDNLFFRCNYPSYIDECTPRELYYGIFYGYFKLSANRNLLDTLVKMCNDVPDNLISKKSHDNPVYNFYILSKHNGNLMLSDIYTHLGRLFRD